MAIFAGDKHLFAPRHIAGWSLFAMAAGVVNGGALMACGKLVTHVTGSLTNATVDTTRAVDFVVVVALFMAGAMFAVLVGETSRSRPKVAFALPSLVAFGLLIALASYGRSGAFGPFGDTDAGRKAIAMLGSLACAMGMLNGSVATVTGNQVRITHATGPMTDLAGNVIRAALGSGNGPFGELRWAMLRSSKLAAFVLGGVIAVKTSGELHYDVFALAAGILIVALGLTAAPEDAEATLEIEDQASTYDPREHVQPIRYEDHAPPFAPERSDRVRDERDAAE